jgi:hypothetical protein
MSIIRTISSLAVFAVTASMVACTAGSDDSASNGSADTANTCDPTGTWAIKVETPVSWDKSFVVQGGTGTITNWLRTTRTADGLNISDTATICGVSTPDYSSAAVFGSEHYGVRFPDALFEAGTLPTFTIAGTLSAAGPGATFTAQPAAAIIGATMTNPGTDPWPANSAQLTSADQDNDGNVGVSVDTATGGDYKDPPLDALKSNRAKKVYTAFRQVLTTQGTISTCNRVDGSGTVAVINNKPAIDQHVLGCLRETGVACAASDFKLLDSAAPVYKPTGDAVVTMVRVPANTTCTDIRAIDFTTATGDTH